MPHGDNTRLGTNIVPKHMSTAEMVEGFKRLYGQLLHDRAIAERVRNKLRHFGARAAPQRTAGNGWQISVQVTGRLNRALARRLKRNLRKVLARTQTRLVLAVEGLRESERREFERSLRSLARYGDRVAIVLGEGLRDLLRFEAPEAVR